MYMAKKVYLSENLAYLRKKRGLRQLQLAQLVGVQPTTLSNYEKGVSNPDFETLGRIMEVLDVSADDLVYLSPAQFQLQCETPKKVRFQVVEPDMLFKKRSTAISEVMKKLTEAQNALYDYQATTPIYLSIADSIPNKLRPLSKKAEAVFGKMEHQKAEVLDVEKL